MRVLDIAVKGVKELFRDRRSFIFTLLFPIILMLFFRAVVGVTTESDTTYSIAVVDLDTGEGLWDESHPPWMGYMNNITGSNQTAPEFFREAILGGHATGGRFLVEEVLKNATYPSGVKRFNVLSLEDEEAARSAVSDDEAVAYVIIPANYSQVLQGVVDWAVVDEVKAHGMPIDYTPPQYGVAIVALSGELTSFDYSFAAAQVSAVLDAYTQGLYREVRTNIGNEFSEGPVSHEAGSVGVSFSSIEVTEGLNIFDLTVPGIIIFGLMMQAMGVTATMGREYKDKTLDRLRMTKMTSFDLLGGTTIRWMVLGVFQVVIFFAVSLLLGLNVAGEVPTTVAAGILVSLAVVLATISLGLIVSSFVDDPDQAISLSVLIVMPMAFFTGAFFPVDIPGAEVLPWTQGAEALRQIMHYAAWGDAMVHTGWCLLGALVLFFVGVITFHRRRLRSG